MFSSWPVVAFFAGVKIGSGRRSDSTSPDGSTRPLSAISVGSTTSNVEIRSLATSSRRSSSRAYSSRTLPLPTWTTSGMNWFLLWREGAEPLEHGLHMTGVGGEVEDGVEVDT